MCHLDIIYNQVICISILGYLFFSLSNSIYAFKWSQWIRCLLVTAGLNFYPDQSWLVTMQLLERIHAHSLPHTSSGLMAIVLGLLSMVLWVPACLGSRGKRKMHSYFAQSSVQESNGGSLCSSSIQVWWKPWGADLYPSTNLLHHLPSLTQLMSKELQSLRLSVSLRVRFTCKCQKEIKF